MSKRIIVLLMVACLSFMTGCSGKASNAEKASMNEEQVKTFGIETVYGKLMYPEQWKDRLRVEQQEESILFWGTVEGKEEKLLFTLEFGKSEGYLLGTLNDVDIYIVDAETEFDSDWTEEEKDQILTMQEDVNVILGGLMEMDNFHLAR